MPPTNPAPPPRLSVIIPVYNGSQYLERCLAALYASDFSSFEVIVVDDCSTDGSAVIAYAFPCKVLKLAANVGPGAARNAGVAEARGDLYFFLDADILVDRDSLGIIAAEMDVDAGLAALFGSYGKKTVPENAVSSYKNLLHHYTHQHSREEASTFCGGFGAIRREAFRQLGGFKPECRFLEDVELGYRMNRLGLRVRLCKTLQLTHCKHYTLRGLFRSDLYGRAIPWTRLMLETGIVRNDLNTRWNNVLSVPAAFLLPVAILLVSPKSVAALLIVLIALNARFLALAFREKGPYFAAQSLVLCWLGYLYSGAGVLMGLAAHLSARRKAVVGRSQSTFSAS